MNRYNRDKAEGTVTHGPTETFENQHIIDMGDMHIEVLHLGPAHSSGDISVWLPGQKPVIVDDMAVHERMLPIFAGTCTSYWLETRETKFEPLGTLYVIPGHGHPTNMRMVAIWQMCIMWVIMPMPIWTRMKSWPRRTQAGSTRKRSSNNGSNTPGL